MEVIHNFHIKLKVKSIKNKYKYKYVIESIILNNINCVIHNIKRRLGSKSIDVNEGNILPI